VESSVPLSAISFYSVSLHKKDAAAIRAKLPSSLILTSNPIPLLTAKRE